MATFYVDLENGDDAADGTSFANRWKTLTNGATAARIGPGDTIRIMASPAPVSIGDVVWTRATNDLSGTVNISSSSTPGTPYSVTTTSAHGFSTGDIVRITGQTGDRYINGLWSVTVTSSTTFTLDGSVNSGGTPTTSGTVGKYQQYGLKVLSPAHVVIDQCEVQWVASTNVTTSVSTTRKQGNGAASIAINASFTTGKAAYRTLPATLDLSSYQKVTFWVRTTATIPASSLSIRLCSDTTGDTSVDTITIPAITGNNAYVPITVNKGSALGGSISSVALYVDSDFGAVTVLIDNIAAVTTYGLETLITPDVDNDTQYPIASIEYNIVTLDGGNGWTAGSSHRGWSGESGTYETFACQPIALTMLASGDIGLTVNDNGSSGNYITYSGGWNRTDMSTQDGCTTIDCRNGLTNGIVAIDKDFVSLTTLIVTRAGAGYNIRSHYMSIIDCAANGCNGGIFLSQEGTIGGWPYAGAWSISGVYACNNSSYGVAARTVQFGSIALRKVNCNGYSTSSTDVGIVFGGAALDVTCDEVCGNQCWGVSIQGASRSVVCYFGKVSDSGKGAFVLTNSSVVSGGSITITEVAEADRNNVLFVLSSSGAGSAGAGEMRVMRLTANNNTYLIRNDTDNNYGRMDYAIRVHSFSGTGNGTSLNGNAGFTSESILAVSNFNGTGPLMHGTGYNAYAETSVRHTASGIAWKIDVTSTAREVRWPVRIPVARVLVRSGVAVTISAWVRRTNTGLTIGIFAFRYQVAGLETDQIATATGSANTWEQVSISFTPTENGVVEVDAYAYGGTTYSGYIDDIEVSGGSSDNLGTLDYSHLGLPFCVSPFADATAGGGITVPQHVLGAHGVQVF